MKVRYMPATGMRSSAKNTCSTRGENCDLVIVVVPMAASTPITIYHSMIATSDMNTSRSGGEHENRRPRNSGSYRASELLLLGSNQDSLLIQRGRSNQPNSGNLLPFTRVR